MATTAQINAIAALYAGYFNRAPDPAGLQFWIDQIDGGREFNTIAEDFAASEEATSLYPYLTAPDVASPSTFITTGATATLQNAADIAADIATADEWTAFTFQGQSYAQYDSDGNGNYDAGSDLLVQITGVSVADLNDTNFA